VQYARDTNVTSAQSRAEIEQTLERYGATQFAYAVASERAMIGFVMMDRQVRFMIPLPDIADFSRTETGRTRAETPQREAWEKATRQRWRALALVVKAKLEAVECGISEFEDEFMANIVLPGGGTVGEFMKPQIARAYLAGDPPNMLPMLGPPGEVT